ncbi:glycosyltransferase family 4 protein [Paracoccaceae bacterium]|nr:glycosyltransferase family 4 protein [Paracoccaceae bacterium]
MHILFLTDNFPPEGNAPATRTFEHAREWVAKGHKLTVITCAPNFPEGEVFEGYRNKWLSKEKIEEIHVWRVKTYITANQGLIKRTFDFLSFMVSSLFFGLFVRKVDVVVGTSPQFFTAISAWALALFKQVPFVFELRDMWPASITAVGAMRESWIINILEKLEFFLYRQADLIVSVTHSFKSELKNRGVSADKIKVVLNGVDLEKYNPFQEKDECLADKYELKNKFVIGYIGTHGLAHALENVIEAAGLIANEDNIRIIFAGGGADRSRLEKIVRDRGLENIVMIPRQSKDQMPQVWSLCDISLVHLKDSPLFRTVIPSKIFESMAMGLPVIMAVPTGEATDIIERYKAGINVLPECPKELSEKFLELAADKELVRTLSYQSLSASRNFDRKKLALEMLNHIEEIVR